MALLRELIQPAQFERCGDRSFPVLSMTMHDGIMLQSDRFKKSLASVDQSAYKVVRRNQLVVGFPIDEGVLYIQQVVDAGIMSPAYDVWNVDETKVDLRYFELCLHSPQSMMFYKTNLRGTTARRRSLPKDTLLSLPVPVPSMERQCEIASTLDRLQALIRLRQHQLCALDQLIKARFVEMFGDVINNTMGWPHFVFSDIASSRLGKMLDAKQQSGKHQFPYLANFNVQWFRFALNNLNKMDFDEDDQAEFELKDGDLIVCEGGEIGRCAIWHNEIQPCYFQKALHRVRCNTDTVIPEYLARWFQFNCEHGGFAAIEGAKATIAHLPGAKLKALQVAVPPLDLQKSFAAFVSQVDKSKLSLSQSLQIS